MTIHRQDGEFLQDISALYYKDRGVLHTITEGWYKEGEELRKFWGERQLRPSLHIPPVEAPILLYLTAPRQMRLSATVDITAVIVGGRYDTLTYVWTILSGGGTITGSGNLVNYQAPYIPATVVIQCTVTARGTGTLARQGTSETLTATATIQIVSLEQVLPAADAPTYNIVADGALFAEIPQQINAVLISGGIYDTIVYVWEILEGFGVITGNVHGNTATYTGPPAAQDVFVTLSLTVTVHGSGVQARDGTSDTSVRVKTFLVIIPPVEPPEPPVGPPTEIIIPPEEPDNGDSIISVIPQPPLRAAEAPDVTIASIIEVGEDEVLALYAAIYGGRYDRLRHVWKIVSGGGFLGGSSRHPIYTPPDVAVDTQVRVRITLTAEGHGKVVRSDTSDTSTDDELFMVRAIAAALPAAVAPAVTLGAVGDVVSGGIQDLEAALVGGTYDEIEYSWAIMIGEALFPQSSDSSSLEYTALEVSEDTEVTAICTVIVRGTGVTARAGTSATANADEDFSVTFVLGAARAPVVTWRPILSVLEGQEVLLELFFEGGVYDTVKSVSFVIQYGGGEISNLIAGSSSGSQGSYTASLVDENTSAAIHAIVIVRGEGVLALATTEDRVVVNETFDVLDVIEPPGPGLSLPNPRAPDVTISFETSINEEETLLLTTSVADGFYDTLEYNWVVVFGGGTIAANSSDESTALYTPPDIMVDTAVQIRCVVTAHGTGVNTRDGASATSSGITDFTVVALSDLPAANVTIHQISVFFIDLGGYTLGAKVSGAYDTITYSWSVPVGTIRGSGSQVFWVLSDPYYGSKYGVTCNVAVLGTGVNAASGTSATDSDSIVVAIDTFPPPTDGEYDDSASSADSGT